MNEKCMKLSVWFLEKSLLSSLHLFFINILFRPHCTPHAGHMFLACWPHYKPKYRDACHRILFLLRIIISNFFLHTQDLDIFNSLKLCMKITITIDNVNSIDQLGVTWVNSFSICLINYNRTKHRESDMVALHDGLARNKPWHTSFEYRAPISDI